MTAEPHVLPETLAAEAIRQRTFRRWLIGIPCVFIALVGLRVMWGYVASNRLQAEIDRIHAEGAPVLASDIPAPKGLPPDMNAADYYARAFAVIDKKGDGHLDYTDATRYFRAYKKYPADADKLVASNQKVLDIVRAASDIDETEWPVVLPGPIYFASLPFLSEVRQVANVLEIAALNRHQHHQDAETLRMVNDLLLLADRLQISDTPSFILNELVAIATQAKGVAVLEEITPTLPIETRKGQARNDDAIPRAQVTAMIHKLLDDEPQWKGYERAVCMERATGTDAMDVLVRNGALPGMFTPPPTPGLTYAVKPMWQLDTVRLIHRLDAMKHAGMSQRWSDVVAADEADEEYYNINLIERMAQYFSGMLAPPLTRVTALAYRMIASRRMAAIALAIRLFEIDHGHRPARLAELVPDYLDAIPIDPFDKDSAPIRYLPDGTPPLLYSVNTNQRDDHGKYMSPGDTKVNNEDFDYVYFLNGDRPYLEMPDPAPGRP